MQYVSPVAAATVEATEQKHKAIVTALVRMRLPVSWFLFLETKRLNWLFDILT